MYSFSILLTLLCFFSGFSNYCLVISWRRFVAASVDFCFTLIIRNKNDTKGLLSIYGFITLYIALDIILKKISNLCLLLLWYLHYFLICFLLVLHMKQKQNNILLTIVIVRWNSLRNLNFSPLIYILSSSGKMQVGMFLSIETQREVSSCFERQLIRSKLYRTTATYIILS